MTRARRFITSAFIVVLFTTSLAASSRADKPDSPPGQDKKDPCKPVLACTTEDLDPALDLERKIADNFYDGQIYDIHYNTAERIPGDVGHVGGFGDSALWTGTYLAAESHRYAVANHYLRKGGKKHNTLTEEEAAFWTAQRDEALARVVAMVDKYNVLVNISQHWSHELQPRADRQYTGFGGGVFPTEPGNLMRACLDENFPWLWPEAVDAKNGDTGPMPAPYTKKRRVFGPFEWTNKDGTTTNYFCEHGTSRDAYAGTIFGLSTAFDLVADDVDGMRDQIRNDVLSLARFAVKYYWNPPRPHGRISIPLPSSDADSKACKDFNDQTGLNTCGHDFESFMSVPPLFVQVPMARLSLIQAARHVANNGGSPVDVAFANGVWAEELATQLPVLAFSMQVDAVEPNAGYFKYNLHHLNGSTLTRLADDPGSRVAFMQAVGVMDKTTGDDINAHFETITYSLTGEGSRLSDAVQHLREWRDYRARIDLGEPTNNAQFCGTSFECVENDQREIILSESLDPIVIDGTSGNQRARRPLPVAVRPPTDFLWQRPPTQLNGFEGATRQSPGHDYLLPYWMLRYHTEVEKPALDPFPVYPGPAHA